MKKVTIKPMEITKAKIKLLRSLHLKKYREKYQLFLVEGIKANQDFLLSTSRFACQGLVISSPIHFSVPDSVPIYHATEQEMQALSTQQSPQGIIGIYALNKTELIDIQDDIVLILDEIQDPGNLGTIIRTCDWFGVKNIICSNNTADCYNPKVLQASMGSLARVQVHYCDLVPWLKTYPHPIIGTTLNGKNIFEQSHSWLQKPCAIVMGNEGNGISAPILQLLTHTITIPRYPAENTTIDSLNVAIATAIILAEARKF